MPGVPLLKPQESYETPLKVEAKPSISENHSQPSSEKTLRLKYLYLGVSVVLILGLLFAVYFRKSEAPMIVHFRPPYSEFVGREDLIDSIYHKLFKEKTQALPIIVLYGEGGIGKTELAVEFGNRFSQKFSLICWIDSATEESLRKSYQRLAEQLNVSYQQSDITEAIESKIYTFLEQKEYSKPWLLVYDNVESHLQLPQRGNGKILITTRNQGLWHSYSCIRVPPFSEEEAFELFTKVTGVAEASQRKMLIEKLHYFPLVIDLAAHFIGETPGVSEGEYLNLLSKIKKGLYQEHPKGVRYSRSLLSSWQMTSDRLRQIMPKALEWLQFASYLFPDAIPCEWLEKWLESKAEQKDSVSIKIQANAILRTLSERSLISYNQTSRSFSLHRLKQEVILEGKHLDRKAPEDVLGFLLNYKDELRRVETVETAVEQWEHLSLWEPSAMWFLTHHTGGVSQEKVAELENILGNWKCVQGDYSKAKELHTSALQKVTTLYGEEHANAIMALGNLAWDFWKLGQFEEAEKKYLKTIALCEKVFGELDIETTFFLNNYTLVLMDLGKYELARVLNKKALKIRKKHYGKIHPHVANSTHNLGWTLSKLGFYEKAKKYYQRAYNQYCEIYGKQHPYVVINTHHQGRLLITLGEHRQAISLLKESLSGYTSLYGQEHPYLAICYHDLAEGYREIEKPFQAVEAYKKAFMIGFKSFGTSHPYLKKYLKDLLDALDALDQRRISQQVKKEIAPILDSVVNCTSLP